MPNDDIKRLTERNAALEAKARLLAASLTQADRVQEALVVTLTAVRRRLLLVSQVINCKEELDNIDRALGLAQGLRPKD